MANARSADIKTPLTRLAFCNLISGQEKTRDNGEKYHSWDASLLFPKGVDLTELKNAAAQVAQEQWGDKAVELYKNDLIKTPFLDGDGKQGLSKKTGERYDGFAGQTFLRVSSNNKVGLFGPDAKPITDASTIYSGCYGYAVINAYAWENPKNGKGISFGISLFQKVKEGDKFGGGAPDARNFFETVGDAGAAPEATKTGDGAAGLFA